VSYGNFYRTPLIHQRKMMRICYWHIVTSVWVISKLRVATLWVGKQRGQVQVYSVRYWTSNVTSVTKVRSSSTCLFAGTWHPWWVLLQHSIMLRLLFIVEWYRVLSLRYACIRSSDIILIPWATFVQNFVSFAAPTAEIAHGEKSCTQSLSHSLTYLAYLMPQ